MPNQRLKYLFDQYVQGNCTPDEKRELSALALALQYDADVQELLDEYWNKVNAEMMMPEEKSDSIVKSVLGSETKVVPGVHRIHFRKARWWAAAAIFILFATGSYFLFFNNKDRQQDEIVKTEPAKDVKAPATNRAMITLADGRTVYLDSATNGQLAIQGNIKLVKLANGQIAYQTASGEIIKELQYNTLSNPRGSKVIDMTLADGSRVWLNAGSSVTYPIAFIGNERKVTVTGEAYFEIAHDKLKPFIVSANNKADVTVLGTHFNVNAYDDEADIKITLLEGSVNVSKESINKLLKPGQQAQVGSDVKVVNNVDTDAVMAWKNGLFSYNGEDLKTIMREVSRWYDVEVVFEDNIDEKFYAEINRNTNVSTLFKMLGKTNAVHFEIENKKVTVKK